MCGRFTLQTNVQEVEAYFDLIGVDERLLMPRYNISPTQPIVVIRSSGVRSESGEFRREAVPMRWGLWPVWVKDPNDFPLLINARADGVATKASFRNAFKRRRCLIPVSGFYEWQAVGKGPKQPFWIAPPATGNGRLLAFAGLWETWCGADGSEVDTATVITTGANQTLAPIHHRMPVIIDPDHFDQWLSDKAEPEMLASLMRPAADERLTAVPVSTRVNSARNDDPDLISPVEVAAEIDGTSDEVDQDNEQPSLF